MSWHCVVIQNSDVAHLSASSLMDQFAAAYRAAEVQKDASVYHGQTTQGDHVYYFSPVASSVAKDVLREFGATPCSEELNLNGFKKIAI
jgi:hypothetical protein